MFMLCDFIRAAITVSSSVLYLQLLFRSFTVGSVSAAYVKRVSAFQAKILSYLDGVAERASERELLHTPGSMI